MRLGELAPAQIGHRLRNSGLRIATGPFIFSVESPLPEIARGLLTLYDQFPLAENGGFADFHVRVRKPAHIRRIVRPQSIFDVDGVMPFKPLPGNQALALLEWGMNWCIYTHAHQFLTLHGAVLERNGRALVLPAPSGSGKSTLCAALMCRGWRLLSDELVLISPETGMISPLCRPVSLKNASIDVIARFAPDAILTEPIPDTSKGTVALMRPSLASVEGASRPARPWRVVFPRYHRGSSTIVTPLKQADVFMRLVDNAFNYSILGRLGFQTMSRMVDDIEGFSAEYDDLDDIIRALDRWVGEGLP